MTEDEWHTKAMRLAGYMADAWDRHAPYHERMNTRDAFATHLHNRPEAAKGTHEGGVEAMAVALRKILNGRPCMASNPPELAEVAKLVSTHAATIALLREIVAMKRHDVNTPIALIERIDALLTEKEPK